VSADDAVRYRELGADGLVLSNHGGRQLDGTIAPLDALPGVRAAVPQLPLLLDGGIRRGTDVMKALALGAACTFTGRPILFAAAAAGQPGVERALAILQAEIDRSQALLGARTLAEIGRAHLAPAAQPLHWNAQPQPDTLPDAPALASVAQADRLAA
jgi:L-lactate dehydrogenase (cytochrome)